MSFLWSNIFQKPIYNFFIFLLSEFSWMDAGMAVIVLTIVVRTIIFPLSKKTIKNQIGMKKAQPEINEVNKKLKQAKNPEEKQKISLEMMAVYKKYQVNPFSSFLLILMQLPIFIALYYVFARSGLPEIRFDLLYSFISIPEKINMSFLGFFELDQSKNLFLALLVLIFQGIQINFSLGKITKKKPGQTLGMQEEIMQNMQTSMRYFMPVMLAVIAFSLPSVISIYFIVGSMFMIAQEFLVRKEKEELKNI